MANNGLTTIEGMLEHIVYASDETHYTVARFQESGKLTHVTIVGTLPGAHAGQTLRLTGTWVSHKRFGEQFQVEQCEEVIPSTALGVERYLASGLIPGI